MDLDLSRPGVYLLARFTKRPPKGRPTLSSKMLYIGETCGQSLRSRLYQFNRSAFLEKLGHSGGATFWNTFRPNDETDWLYVSVMSTSDEEPAASAYIRYVERALIWAHVQHHKALPECNRK
jgi:hypothetical protein